MADFFSTPTQKNCNIDNDNKLCNQGNLLILLGTPTHLLKLFVFLRGYSTFVKYGGRRSGENGFQLHDKRRFFEIRCSQMPILDFQNSKY